MPFCWLLILSTFFSMIIIFDSTTHRTSGYKSTQKKLYVLTNFLFQMLNAGHACNALFLEKIPALAEVGEDRAVYYYLYFICSHD